MTREERLEKLKKRQNEKNTNRRTYAYNIPTNVPIYKAKEGMNLIDIIPYRITNKDNPAIRQGFEIGEPDYCQIIHSHRDVGPNKNGYLCEQRMFGKLCPICEAQKDFWEMNDKENAKKLYPKEHGVYNIIDLLEPEKGVQVWMVSTFWVEEELSKLAAMKSKAGEPIIYGDHEVGWSIEFYGMEETFGGKKFYQPKNFNFVKREKQYDDSILDKTYPLDQWYNRVPYEVIEADYLGVQIEKPTTEPAHTEEPPKQEMSVPTAEPPKRERRRREKKAENLCPFGHKWGECDDHDDCAKCDDENYNKCADIQDGITN